MKEKSTSLFVILGILLVVVLLLVVLLVVLPLLQKSTKDHTADGAVQEIRYSCGGSMTGDSYNICLKRNPADDTATLSIEEAQWHYYPFARQQYTVPAEALDTVSALLDGYGVRDWGERPPSDEMVLDASSCAFSMTCKNARYGYFDSQKLPQNGQTVFADLRTALLQYAQNENSSLHLTDGSTAAGKTQQLQPVSCENGYLLLWLSATGEEEAAYLTDYTLLRVEDDTETELFSAQLPPHETDRPTTVLAGDSVPFLLDLNPAGRLTPGAYLLRTQDVSVPFTLGET